MCSVSPCVARVACCRRVGNYWAILDGTAVRPHGSGSGQIAGPPQRTRPQHCIARMALFGWFLGTGGGMSSESVGRSRLAPQRESRTVSMALEFGAPGGNKARAAQERPHMWSEGRLKTPACQAGTDSPAAAGRGVSYWIWALTALPRWRRSRQHTGGARTAVSSALSVRADVWGDVATGVAVASEGGIAPSSLLALGSHGKSRSHTGGRRHLGLEPRAPDGRRAGRRALRGGGVLEHRAAGRRGRQRCGAAAVDGCRGRRRAHRRRRPGCWRRVGLRHPGLGHRLGGRRAEVVQALARAGAPRVGHAAGRPEAHDLHTTCVCVCARVSP